MLHQNIQSPAFPPNEMADTEPGGADVIDLDRIAGIVRRRWKVVALAIVLGLALGALYLLYATPMYKATAEILIDQSNGRLTTEIVGGGEVMESDAAILSEVELMSSQRLAVAAVDRLDLGNNTEFLATGQSGLGRLRDTIFGFLGLQTRQPSADPEARRQRAIGLVSSEISVSRIGRTFILALSFTAENRQLAADIANALAESYLAEQLDSKFETTRVATEWLEQRIAELRAESLRADLAVQTYRTANNLVSVDGQLVSEQQVTAINAELVKASTETAEAKANLDHIESILASGSTDAVVNDALDSSLINQLRSSYLEAARRLANVEQAVGTEHEQALRLRSEIEGYQQQITQELQRIAESYRSTYEVAKAAEDSLLQRLTDATGLNAEVNSTQAKLRELELEADSVRNLYQSFLESYQSSAQRASFPIVEARIVTEATAPGRPSSPVLLLVLGAGGFLGMLAGVGLAGVNEFRDRFVRTGEQLRSSIGIEFLGLVPLVEAHHHPAQPKGPVRLSAQLSRSIALPRGTAMSYATEHPLSQFAETLRSTKVGADLALYDQKCKVLAMASILPGEGKSTISANFGQLLASSGARTLLIDADLRNPSLSQALAPDGSTGLIEAVIAGSDIAPFIRNDPQTGMDFLSVGAAARTARTVDVLASAGFENLLDRASQHYDYILLDLPPIGAVVDARAISTRVDAFVLVVHWGRTPRQLVRTTLRAEPRIADKCIGAILNKVNLTKHRLYSPAGIPEAHQAAYASYYREG
jgi:polysaccharide biosynthesis transport protein